MPRFEELTSIAGVQIVHLDSYDDSRGRFSEFFRKEWFPQCNWGVVQCNRSESAAGVLRGLHYHHRQVDYWHLVQGKIRVGLVDLRGDSTTRLASQTLDIDGSMLTGLFIPTGVAHGFFALTQATLFYVVNNYFDGTDEYGLAWNDPRLALEWGIRDPVLSARDLANPFLDRIPAGSLPPGLTGS